MKRIIIAALLCLTVLPLLAQSFTVDGINYSVLDASKSYVEITSLDTEYDGDLEINGTVLYDGNTYYLKSIRSGLFGGGPFYCCERLRKIGDLPCLEKISTTAFTNCFNLETIGNMPACKSIGNRAFTSCQNLKEIGDLPTCTNIEDYAFDGCTKLTSIGNLPACTSIGGCAFDGCNNLTTVGDLSACTSIGNYAFAYCSNLVSIDALSACTSLGDYAFIKCSRLEDVGNLSACTKIGKEAFRGCTSLKNIGDLYSCTSLGDKVFYGCKNLYRINLPGDKLVTISGTPIDAWHTVAVPATLLTDYRKDDNWKDIAVHIISLDAKTIYDVTATADANMSGVQWQIGEENLRNVESLKVRGTINGYDIMIFRNKMPNLHYLDLGETKVIGNSYNYYQSYAMTKDDILGDYAFAFLDKLVTVILPSSLKGIGAAAFDVCTTLKDVRIYEGITEIPSGCFHQNQSLCTIDIPEGITNIGSFAFSGCESLTNVNLPNSLETIDSYAFYNCNNITSVRFPNTLQKIGDAAFSSCVKLSSLLLPTSLKTIDYSAFSDCSSLSELHIPPSLTSIGNNAFSNCSSLNDIYTYTVEPVAIGQNTFSTWTTATIHTPSQSHDNYYWDTQWSQFLEQVDFDEPYEYFYINNDYKPQTQFTGEPNADLNEGSGLIVDNEGGQDLGDLHHHHNGDGEGASIIDEKDLTAKSISFEIRVQAGRWYFFSFPFNVNLADITAPGSYVFRHYDGLVRAQLGSGGWKELGEEETQLVAGRGYIFQCSKAGTLVLHVDKPDFKGGKGGKDNPHWQHDLAENSSERGANDAGWNFIGNPYLSYYDLDHTGYQAPVTRWNGTSYEAIRPGDDDYFFHPFEAFFVQNHESENTFDFYREHRETYQQSQRSMERKQMRRRAMKVSKDRQLVNLVLTAGDQTDKTRVVFNEAQQLGYEAACDAAKFLTAGVPQLFSLDATGEQVKYAINERPADNGIVRLGISAPAATTLTLSAPRRDADVVLRDLLTGATWDFENGDYSFETEAGTFCDRFLLVKKASTTSLSQLDATQTEENSAAYNAAGQRVNSENAQGVVIYTNGKKQLR